MCYRYMYPLFGAPPLAQVVRGRTIRASTHQGCHEWSTRTSTIKNSSTMHGWHALLDVLAAFIILAYV